MFRLVMAGAQWRDRIGAALGGAIGIGVTAWVSALAGFDGTTAILLAAPIGASAVLVFAVPSSPLAQPWRVIGGNGISALVGLAVAWWLGHGALAAGVAVGLAILVMSLTRSLHPPGGGTVLLPVLAPAVLAKGLGFVLLPIGTNAVLLTLCGLLVHRFTGHSYPHRVQPAPPAPGLRPEDIDAALEEAGEAFDVSRGDLLALLARAEHHAAARRE
ncbi:HPP family protein [Sphingomonas trueperi]|uniref:HPP family protein n=1 Tax=Sphingomonas trueperi TaxID=53317 RepID=UPI000F27A4ED